MPHQIPKMTDLKKTHVLAIDCQTTGATPIRGRVLELGWAMGSGETVGDPGNSLRSYRPPN